MERKCIPRCLGEVKGGVPAQGWGEAISCLTSCRAAPAPRGVRATLPCSFPCRTERESIYAGRGALLAVVKKGKIRDCGELQSATVHNFDADLLHTALPGQGESRSYETDSAYRQSEIAGMHSKGLHWRDPGSKASLINSERI